MATGLARKKIEDFIENVAAVHKEFRSVGRDIPTRRAAQIAAMRPAKRFYISTEEAVRQINNIENGRKLAIKSGYKRDMYYEIYKRYVEEMLDGEKVEYKYALIERIISSTAPQFYMNPKIADRQIRLYYHKLREEARKRNVDSI